MKYLLIQPSKRCSTTFEVLEFATAEELATFIRTEGTKGAIVAQRVGINVQLCEWERESEEAF